MKQQSISALGKCFGSVIKFTVPIREGLSDPVSDPTIEVDGKSLVLDFGRLPKRVSRLVPPRFLHAPAEAWESFIAEARLMGLI